MGCAGTKEGSSLHDDVLAAGAAGAGPLGTAAGVTAAAQADNAEADRLRAETPAGFYAALRAVEGGGEPPMLLLRGSWIRKQGEEIRKAKERGDTAALRALAITYRQQMPKEAFMTAEEVEEQSKTINSGYRRLAAGAMSYCWEIPHHPDPVCNSFLALADALERCHEEKRKDNEYGFFPEDIGIFWDYPFRLGAHTMHSPI